MRFPFPFLIRCRFLQGAFFRVCSSPHFCQPSFFLYAFLVPYIERSFWKCITETLSVNTCRSGGPSCGFSSLSPPPWRPALSPKEGALALTLPPGRSPFPPTQRLKASVCSAPSLPFHEQIGPPSAVSPPGIFWRASTLQSVRTVCRFPIPGDLLPHEPHKAHLFFFPLHDASSSVMKRNAFPLGRWERCLLFARLQFELLLQVRLERKG